MPVTKSRLAFKILASDMGCAVEFLGTGQQVVAEGPHAKGAMHYWENDIGLIEGHGTMRRHLLTVHDVDALMKDLKEGVDRDERLERIRLSLPTMRDRAAAVSITNLASPHYAKGENGQALLKRAIAKIDIDDASLESYDNWIRLLRAIKAACAGNYDFFLDTVWPWAQGNAGNVEKGIEWVQERWDRFRDSQLGAEYVL